MRFPVCGARRERLFPKLPADYFQLLNANIECSAEEAQSIYNKFRALAPSGRLNLSSFQECLGLFGTLGRLMAERIFRAFDLNNDGYLDFVEFSSSLLIMTKGSEDKKLALSYRIIHPNPHNLPTTLVGSLEMSSEESSPPDARTPDSESPKGARAAERAKLRLELQPIKSGSIASEEGPGPGPESGGAGAPEARPKELSERSSSISFIRRTTETIINTTKIIRSNITEMGQDRGPKPDAAGREDEGIQFGEFVDVVNDIALTRALLVCRDPRYYTNEEIRKLFQTYASVSSEGTQRLTQSDFTNAVCESTEFLELLGVSLSHYAMESVSSTYKGANLMQRINATTRSYINRTKVKRKNVYKWINHAEAKRGLSVHFGHESWNHVVNMMIGLSISARYVYSQEERALCDEDYNVKLCFDIVENYQGLNVSKYVTNTGLSSSRFRNLAAYNAMVAERKGGQPSSAPDAATAGRDAALGGQGQPNPSEAPREGESTTRPAEPTRGTPGAEENGAKASSDPSASLNGACADRSAAGPGVKNLRIVDNRVPRAGDPGGRAEPDNFSTNTLNIISGMSNSSLLSSDMDFRFSRFYKDNLADASNPRPATYAIKSKIAFKEYAPMVFRQIRRMSGLSEHDYVQSVSPEQIVGNMVLGNLSTMSELVSEGKSGALFYYTINGRLILKTVTKGCAKFVKGWLKSYFAHLEACPSSILTRFYGLFSIQNLPTASGPAGQRSKKTYFVVMNNVFYSRVSIHRRFDLKGSWVGRTLHPSELKDPTVALKDVDFDRLGELILLGSRGAEFMAVLRADVLFLRRSNLLDYSLLLGVHYREQSRDRVDWEREPDALPGEQHRAMATDRSRIYYMGIVDLLTPWDFSKRLEHLWRVCSTRQHQGVSCVSPERYCARFVQFISTHLR